MTIQSTGEALDDEFLLGYRNVWEATLEVDQSDPFFFDHPLDHVPAMMLLEAVMRVAERAVTGSSAEIPGGRIARLQLEFQQFCELTSPPLVRIWPDQTNKGHWHVEFCQDGTPIGSGLIEWRRACTTASQPGRARTVLPEPAQAELVHRQRPENVLVSELTQVASDAYQVEVLAPPPGHYFRRRNARFRPVGELLEGARQFGTLLGHVAHDVGLGSQFVVRSMEVELSRPVSRDEAVSIRSQTTPRSGRTATMTFEIRAGGDLVGTAVVLGSAFSARAYERLRMNALEGQGHR